MLTPSVFNNLSGAKEPCSARYFSLLRLLLKYMSTRTHSFSVSLQSWLYLQVFPNPSKHQIVSFFESNGNATATPTGTRKKKERKKRTRAWCLAFSVLGNVIFHLKSVHFWCSGNVHGGVWVEWSGCDAVVRTLSCLLVRHIRSVRDTEASWRWIMILMF